MSKTLVPQIKGRVTSGFVFDEEVVCLASKEEEPKMAHCFSPSKEGYRAICLLGGVEFCVNPPNPTACRYMVADEELIVSPNGNMAFKLVAKVEAPELSFYLLNTDNIHVAGPLPTRQAALKLAEELFEEQDSLGSSLLNNLPDVNDPVKEL